MRKMMLLALAGMMAVSCASSKRAVARRDPVPAVKTFRSVAVNAPYSQSEGDVTVAVRPVPEADRLQVQVVDPDSYERVRDSFNPFSHPGVVDTTVLLVSVSNSGRSMVTVPAPHNVTVAFAGETRSVLSAADLDKAWREYATRVTYNAADWPIKLEQERSWKAIDFIDSNTFKGGAVPPGGHLMGYLAVSNALLTPGTWTLTFPALRGSQGAFPEFKFTIDVS